MQAASDRIYLDFAATTPVLPEVLQVMEPWLAGGHGNPSSQHAEGRAAKAALDEARERVSEAAGAEFAEVIFTSGATEALNLALVGTALGDDSRRNRILMSAAEHHAVLHTAPLLARLGYHVEILEVDGCGVVSPDTLEANLGEDVLLVAIMHTNNELGSVNPIGELAHLAHDVGASFLCDVVQTELDQTREDLGRIELRALSAHKLGGPKGVGALIARNGHKLKPLIAGGEQERERRGGTENVAGIVGFGKAATMPFRPVAGAMEAFKEELPPEFRPTLAESPAKILHGRISGLDAETVLIRLDRAGVAASSGAACSSGSVEPSHVLLALGWTEKEAKEALRFSFGPGLTPERAREAGRRFRLIAEDLLARRS